MSVLYNIPFTRYADKKSEDKFKMACSIYRGRNIAEEYVAAKIWPLSHGWAPKSIVYLSVFWYHTTIPFPQFGFELVEDQTF